MQDAQWRESVAPQARAVWTSELPFAVEGREAALGEVEMNAVDAPRRRRQSHMLIAAGGFVEWWRYRSGENRRVGFL